MFGYDAAMGLCGERPVEGFEGCECLWRTDGDCETRFAIMYINHHPAEPNSDNGRFSMNGFTTEEGETLEEMQTCSRFVVHHLFFSLIGAKDRLNSSPC